MGLCAVIASSAFAQDISIEVELSSKRIPLGSTAQLVVTVNGSQDVQQIQLPKIEGFDVNYAGPSTRVSIVNGQYSSSKAFTYSLFPLKVGQFKIPSFDVIVSGKTFRVDPVSLEVIEGESQTAQGAGQQVALEDKIFMVLKTSKNEVYLNERFPVQVFLFVSDFSVTDIQFPQFDNVGFSIGEYTKPEQYQQVIDGIRYSVVEFKTEVYPTRTGELSLGPAKTECSILVTRSGGKPPFGRQGSIFGDDFFDSFFGRQEKRSIALKSSEIRIKILPLPEDGKPKDFSGAVGQFDFNVSVSPTEVKEGDPITLRTTVIGNGKLTPFEMPALPSSENFKLYDPQVFEKDNIRKTEQVIIPQSNQITQVPEIRFSYFDPELRKYQTIKKGPFPITVKNLEKGEEFKVVGLEGQVKTAEPEKLGQDIVFIKDRPGNFRSIKDEIYRNGLFYFLMFIYAVLWLGGFLYYQHTHRMKTDVVYARRLRAPKQAKQGLAEARKLMAARKGVEFYDTVFKTIQQYLRDKLHLSSGAVTFETVQAYLNNNRIERNVIDDIKLVYDECDMIRYASADMGQENMSASYQRLARIIDHLERFLK
ncbi:MAG: protein BatD [Candidatus Omnitrophica bacterium]|nr:protein BatD [Candidatus Omnitrophota bacterium]